MKTIVMSPFLKEQLVIVLDLADQAALTSEFAGDSKILEEQRDLQQQAMKVVYDLITEEV